MPVLFFIAKGALVAAGTKGGPIGWIMSAVMASWMLADLVSLYNYFF